MYDSVDKLRQMILEVEKTNRNFRKIIGDHCAKLALTDTDGKRTKTDEQGHFDFYEYESSIDRWTQVASFPGNGIYGQAAFVRKNKAYLVGGVRNNSDIVTDVWEFSKDKWIQKAPFPGHVDAWPRWAGR